MNIYVGNLDRQATEQDLTQLFLPYGELKSVKIMKDNATGEPRGFAFVEILDSESATKAIKALDYAEFRNRRLRVNEAKPKNTGPRVYNSFSSNFGYKDRHKSDY